MASGTWALIAGLAVLAVIGMRYLRELYALGTPTAREFVVARNAMLVPAMCTAGGLLVLVLLSDPLPALVRWLPSVLALGACGGGAWALERGRLALKRARSAARDK